MSPLTLEAPAKLNLSLRVLGKRDDGFHEIQTTMVKLPGLADRITIEPAAEFSFRCDDPDVPSDEQNLVVKAVLAYQSAAGVPCAFSITLHKTIPHGAGLGGGSSDAAATLLGLDRLHDGGLGPARLHELAASLGSDIPFFLKPGAAVCKGRGEIIESVPAPAPMCLLLLKPSFAVPTPQAYAAWMDSVELPGITYAPQEINGSTLVNDLERPVFQKHRVLAELKQWLLERRETCGSLLSGSGSTVFAILRDEADARELARSARHEIDPHLWTWAGVTGD